MKSRSDSGIVLEFNDLSCVTRSAGKSKEEGKMNAFVPSGISTWKKRKKERACAQYWIFVLFVQRDVKIK